MIRKHLRSIFMAAVLGLSITSVPTKAQPQSYIDQFCQAGRVISTGTASWYGPRFHGRKTANGERFNMHAMTAAHKTLPLGTWLNVENAENGEHLLVRINDRGPYIKGRMIDLSKGAAEKLGFDEQGTTKVVLRICS